MNPDKENRTNSHNGVHSNAEYLTTVDNQISGVSLLPPPIFPNQTIQKKETGKEKVANAADKTNAAGNIQGGILDKFMSRANDAMKSAEKSMDEAKKLEKLAAQKAAKAKRLQKIAGSGKSAQKSAAASKAAKAANQAKIAAAAKMRQAQKMLNEAQGIMKMVPKVAKLLKKIPLDKLGPIAAILAKALTTTNSTTGGKIADTLGTAGLDVAFGSAHPIVAAIDAVIGLIPGGDKINISNTMSNSVTSITGTAESIITGDTRGISTFHEDNLKGKNTWFFKKAAQIGEEYSKFSKDRVQTTGDYYGGANTVKGRAGAFLAAVPGVGDVGEGLGYGAFKTYEFGKKTADKASKFAKKNWTTNPDEIDWDRTLKPWKW